MLTGIVYGLVVWTVMNMVVLSLWSHKPFVFNPESFPINALIIIVAIGLPLSYIATGIIQKNKIRRVIFLDHCWNILAIKKRDYRINTVVPCCL